MRDIKLPAGIRGVVFDVGETLVDDSRAWARQAERAGVTPFTLMGLLGALIDRDEDHRHVWDLLGSRRHCPVGVLLEATAADGAAYSMHA